MSRASELVLLVALVAAVAVVFVACVAGNAYVTHEKSTTYRQCIANKSIAECKGLRP